MPKTWVCWGLSIASHPSRVGAASDRNARAMTITIAAYKRSKRKGRNERLLVQLPVQPVFEPSNRLLAPAPNLFPQAHGLNSGHTQISTYKLQNSACGSSYPGAPRHYILPHAPNAPILPLIHSRSHAILSGNKDRLAPL